MKLIDIWLIVVNKRVEVIKSKSKILLLMFPIFSFLSFFDRKVLCEEISDSVVVDTLKISKLNDFSDSLFTQIDTSFGEPIKYIGQKIEYSLEEDRITLMGHAKVKYKEISVDADTVQFYVKKRIILALGKPSLRDGERVMTGKSMVYSILEKDGEVRDGRSTFEKGFYWGRRIRKVGEKEFNVSYGNFTTCSHNPPHYHFWAKRMKLFQDDKVVAEPVVLMIHGIPVAAIPYWVFPIRKGRHSGLLVPRIGENRYEGKFIKNLSYYQILGTYGDGTIGADITEKLGWIINLEGRYIYLPKLNSQINTSYTDGGETRRKEWRVLGDHIQSLPMQTNLSFHLDYVSTRTYLVERGDERMQRLERNLRSYGSLQKGWRQGSAFIAFEQSKTYDTSGVTYLKEQVPQIRISQNIPLSKLFYASYSASGLNIRERSLGVSGKHYGANQDFNFSSSPKLGGWLLVSPRFSYHESWYDRDTLGTKFVRRGIYSLGAGINTTIYGIFKPIFGPFLGARHILVPEISYNFTPEVNQDRFPPFLGRYSPQKFLSLGLRNTFQVKFKRGDKSTKLDIATLDFSTSMDFRTKPRKFNTLSINNVILPTSRLTQIRTTASYDLTRKKFQRIDITSSLYFSGGGVLPPRITSPLDTEEVEEKVGPWSLALAYSYGRGELKTDETQQLWGTLSFHPTKNWKIDYSQRYDPHRKQIISQDWVIYRDLHCWEARLSAQTSQARWSYELKINIKAIPDIKFERKRAGESRP